MHSRIGRSRGFGGTHIQRFRAGQRVNIPRSIWGSGRPMVRNTTIYLGGYSGGNHCCCGGGGSKFLNWMTGITAFMGVFSGFFGSFFGSRQTPAEDPNTSYTAGYQAGLGTLTGNASAAQGAYSQGQIVSKSNELTDLICDLNADYNFSFPEGEHPKLSDDGQKYTYDGKEFDTITKLRNYIEDKNSLKAKTPADPAGNTSSNDRAIDYKNKYDINNGFKYENDNVTIIQQNVPEIVTLSAFILNDNDDSTISLTKKNWENNFKLIAGNADTMTVKQFTKWFKNYAKEAKNAKSPRVATDTFDMTESDDTFIKQLYKAMSNNGTTLSATQFKTFMEGFFNDTNYSNDGSFSRKEFADYVEKKIKEQNNQNGEE